MDTEPMSERRLLSKLAITGVSFSAIAACLLDPQSSNHSPGILSYIVILNLSIVLPLACLNFGKNKPLLERISAVVIVLFSSAIVLTVVSENVSFILWATPIIWLLSIATAFIKR